MLWHGYRSKHRDDVTLRGTTYQDHWLYITTGNGMTGWVHAATLTKTPPFFDDLTFDDFLAQFPDLPLPYRINGYRLIEEFPTSGGVDHLLGLKYLCQYRSGMCEGMEEPESPSHVEIIGKFRISELLWGCVVYDYFDVFAYMELLVYDNQGRMVADLGLADCHDGLEFMTSGEILSPTQVSLFIAEIDMIGGALVAESVVRRAYEIDPISGETQETESEEVPLGEWVPQSLIP